MSAPASVALSIDSFRPRKAADGYHVVANEVTGKKEIHFSKDIRWTAERLQTNILTPVINSTAFGGMTQFQITPGSVSRLHHVTVSLVVAETSGGGGATVTSPFAQYFASQVQLCPNNQSTPLVSLTPEFCLWAMEDYPIDKINALTFGGQMNIVNIATQAPAESTAILSGASKTLTYIIEHALLKKLPVEFLTSNFLINMLWQASSPAVAAASGGTLGISSCQLMLHYRKDPATTQVLSDLFYSKKVPFVLSYDAPIVIDYPLTLTAGAQTTQLLSGVVGAVSTIDIALIASTAFASGAYRTYTTLDGANDWHEALGSLDLLDSARNSILGSGNSLTGSLSRFSYPAVHAAGTQFSLAFPVYHIWATPKPSEDQQTGSCNGAFILDGSQYLRISPGASFSTGAYTVRCIFHRKAQVHVGRDGSVAVDY